MTYTETLIKFMDAWGPRSFDSKEKRAFNRDLAKLITKFQEEHEEEVMSETCRNCGCQDSNRYDPVEFYQKDKS